MVGLPSQITHPEYLPVDFPPATNYAAIDDVDAVPYLNDTGENNLPKISHKLAAESVRDFRKGIGSIV